MYNSIIISLIFRNSTFVHSKCRLFIYMLNEIECEINKDRNEILVCAGNFPPPIQERFVAGAHTETATGNVAECGKQFWALE